MVSRANEFIGKLKQARVKSSEAKAKAEAKAQATAKARARELARKPVEPVFASLEEALVAAQACTKCLPTRLGSKGCRACMGEFFEHIRQKGKPKETLEAAKACTKCLPTRRGGGDEARRRRRGDEGENDATEQ